MARTLCIVVGDDFNLLSQARQWGESKDVDVMTYTVSQWESGLENPQFRSQIHLEPMSLNAGFGQTNPGGQKVEGGARILQFPTPNSSDKKVQTFEQMEADAIRAAIMEFRGNLTEAARALGIGRATLYRKVKQYNIDPSQARNRHRQAA